MVLGIGIKKKFVALSEGHVTICSPSTSNIALGFRLRAILPASDEQIVMHYANMSVQYTAIFHGCKNGNFQMKKCEKKLFLLKT